jgi:hypothetical protein
LIVRPARCVSPEHKDDRARQKGSLERILE